LPAASNTFAIGRECMIPSLKCRVLLNDQHMLLFVVIRGVLVDELQLASPRLFCIMVEGIFVDKLQLMEISNDGEAVLR
jgi:hypothetical protein